MKDNIVLIGMPGAGKSTVGVVLAKAKGYQFIDSDILIQEKHGKLLQELISEYGISGFRSIENDVNKSIQVQKSVIATGGSAIYCVEAMEHLSKMGTVVYLQLSFKEIEKRLGDLTARGVTLQKNQTLRELYQERIPFYEKYADKIIECDGLMLREVIAEILEKVSYMNRNQ